MINLAANPSKLLSVSKLIRRCRFLVFSHEFIVFRYVTDFRRGL